MEAKKKLELKPKMKKKKKRQLLLAQRAALEETPAERANLVDPNYYYFASARPPPSAGPPAFQRAGSDLFVSSSLAADDLRSVGQASPMAAAPEELFAMF